MGQWMLPALAALLVASPVFGAAGLIAKKSPYPVAETIDRLEKAAKERDLIVVARIDHAAAARKVGLALRPTELLIFGNPRGGTPLMQSQQAVGIDLPLRALAWEDERGQVWLAYNDPAYLAERHGIKDRPEVVRAMGSALEALTEAATKAAR